MSTDLPHYNKILRDLWLFTDNIYCESNLIYQPSVLQIPYCSTNGWPMNLPEIPASIIDEEFVCILHLQDSLTYKNNECVELKKIEYNYPIHAHKNIVVIVEDIGLVNSYAGNLHVVWFPTFVYELMQQMQKNKQHWDQYIQTEPSKNYICLNGIPKTFRRHVAYYLQANFENGIISLGNEIPLEKCAYQESYIGNDNPENFVLLDWVFSDSALNIVTETIYYESIGIITEKTIFAFLAGQIPILIAHQGFITELKQMGFDMFTDIVNTSYDRYCNQTRWKAAIDLNADLIRSGVSRKDFEDRLERNKQHALEVWPNKLISNYINQMHSFGFNHTDLKILQD